jgi:type II secretory pathway pseudopilin PulG
MLAFNTKRKKLRAFTLLELLAIVTIISIMAALLIPALASTQRKSERIACLYNMRQLDLACKLYADDNNGSLVSSWPIGSGKNVVNPQCWCPGWVSYTEPTGQNYGPNPDYNCTNVNSLKQGAIWQYLRFPAVYHCPAEERSLGNVTVVRSYSMNAWMNGQTDGDPTGASAFVTPTADSSLTYTLFRKESQLTRPSGLWSMIEEDASTINDAMFMVDMGKINGVPDLPSTRHGNSYTLSFSDSHIQTVKFLAPSTAWNSSSAVPDPDWVNLKSMTTESH